MVKKKNLCWSTLKCEPKGVNRSFKNFFSKQELKFSSFELNKSRINSNFDQKITFFYNKDELKNSDTVTLYATLSKNFLLEIQKDIMPPIDSTIEVYDFDSFFCPRDINLQSDIKKLLYVYDDPNLIELNLFSDKLQGNIYMDHFDVARVVDLSKEQSDIRKKVKVHIDGHVMSNLLYKRYLPFLELASDNKFAKILVKNFEYKFNNANINNHELISEHFASTGTRLKSIDLKFDNLNIRLDGKRCILNSSYIFSSYTIMFLLALKKYFDSQYSVWNRFKWRYWI